MTLASKIHGLAKILIDLGTCTETNSDISDAFGAFYLP